MRKIRLLILLGFAAGIVHAQLSPDAPPDKPFDVTDKQMEEYEKAIAPYVAQARRTLPEAKRKYTSGLGLGQTFFLTIRIYDPDKNFEQVFVRITEWKGKTIAGVIASELNVVTSYRAGEKIKFKKAEVLDWLIAHPDGSEEGNFVGNFLDTYRK
ncbi:MAG: DUF2314 domain-containing protein [Ferruginibacter sp.]|nr:DUF2314 domain-containing protein [Cytophagales bacterium]